MRKALDLHHLFSSPGKLLIVCYTRMYFFLIAAVCQKCQFVLFAAEQTVESTAGGIHSTRGTDGKPTHGSEVTAVQQLSPRLRFSEYNLT